MRIERLDHVQLAMPAGGENAARDFYARTLGIPEVQKPPHQPLEGYDRRYVDDPFGNRIELMEPNSRSTPPPSV